MNVVEATWSLRLQDSKGREQLQGLHDDYVATSSTVKCCLHSAGSKDVLAGWGSTLTSRTQPASCAWRAQRLECGLNPIICVQRTVPALSPGKANISPHAWMRTSQVKYWQVFLFYLSKTTHVNAHASRNFQTSICESTPELGEGQSLSQILLLLQNIWTKFELQNPPPFFLIPFIATSL